MAATEDKHRILILGDSISAGYGVPANNGWVALLSDALSAKAKVINASISGETTVGGRDRIHQLLEQHQPTVVVIELGGNDGLRGFPLNSIEQNLSHMIEQSQKSQACGIVLLGMRIPPNYGSRYSEGFYNMYGDLADSYKTYLVPFFLEGIATRPTLMQQDGIHPTSEAQSLLLENALPTINQAMLNCQR
ncbi:MAG: hypothetical protein RL336_558 [Pseudomonadota bacterium]